MSLWPLALSCAAARSQANYQAAEIEIVHEALREHIDRRLREEPAIRKKFNDAREKRLALEGGNVTVLSTAK